MKAAKPFPDPSTSHHLLDESDIGAGGKTLAERETDALIRHIPPLAEDEDPDNTESESSLNLDESERRREHDQSLDRDEPDGGLNYLDPVPPKGA